MQVFEDFVCRREAGEDVQLAGFLARLPLDADRDEFLHLVEALEWTEDRLPVRMRPNLLLEERYRLREPIGRGGMGQVWRAVDEKLGQPVAVKVLNLLGTALADARPVIAKETRILAQLDHPGIVKILDAGKDGEHAFIVMSLVDGTPLDEVIAGLRERHGIGAGARLGAGDLIDAIDRPLPAGRTEVVSDEDWYRSCARVTVEILRILESAHDRRIVHRDLKPANVMLCGGANPVLLDFGLGGQLDAAAGDMTSGMFGTVAYIAPEQWSAGALGNEPASDIYQMGLVLYEFLTLQRAFSDDPTEAIRTIPKGLFRRPREIDPRIPSPLEHVCLEAMELAPGRRYRSAELFRADLSRFLTGVQPLAERRKLGISTRRVRYFVRRHRRAMGIAAAILLTASLTALWMYWSMARIDLTWQVAGSSFRVEPNDVQRVFAFALFGSAGRRPETATHVLPLALAGSGGQPPSTDGVFIDGRPGSNLVRCAIPRFKDLVPLRIRVAAVRASAAEREVREIIRELAARMGRDHRPLELVGPVRELWQPMRPWRPGRPVPAAEFFGEAAIDAGDLRVAGLSLR